MSVDLDLLVLGGGCAGLSLAERLAQDPGRCRRVALLESRSSYANDRSWCFWRLHPHRHEALVRRSWSQVRVRSTQQAVQVRCAATPYQMLEAGTFYAHAQSAIAASETVRLHTGVAVLAPARAVPGGWRVETSAGGLTAAQVIDTRPQGPPRLQATGLWQSFLGQELVCDRPVFDTSQVELMDFTDVAQGVLAFTYVLPLASDQALIETTVFHPQPHGPTQLAGRQQQAVQRLCGNAQTHVVRTECGVLPMAVARPAVPLGPGHAHAGLMSGAARPATGYAFQRIQRWADACSLALRDGEAVFGHRPDGPATRFMDQLFLDVLRKHPERGPELFTRLFARTATARVVRFLGDRPTLADRVAVAASLPTALFLRELVLPARRRVAQALTL